MQSPNPHPDFEKVFRAALRVSVVELAGDALSGALVRTSVPSAAIGAGTCTCGRAALVLGRCAHCTKEALMELPPHPWQGRRLGEEPLVDPDKADVEDMLNGEVREESAFAAVGLAPPLVDQRSRSWEDACGAALTHT